MTKVEAGEVAAIEESEKVEFEVELKGVNNSWMYNCKHSHLWMDQGCQNNSVIHGYFDGGWQVGCMAIRGWTRDVTDTLTEGGR